MSNNNVGVPDSDSEDELPPGWEERVTADGCVYYVNHATEGTQWTHPRTGVKKTVSGDLPMGWEKTVDSEGKITFFNKDTHVKTYTDPRIVFASEEKENPLDIRQKYDHSTKALQILHGRDLSNYNAIVTGANTGIGFETARSLALHGARVILACRNLESAAHAIARIQAEKSTAQCVSMEIDLTSLSSVRQFAREYKRRYRTLNILILNAGVFGLGYSHTVDDYETTFQVNHLSHFFLTMQLEDVLIKGAKVFARVVVVSSESHRHSLITKDNITKSYLSIDKYSDYWAMGVYNNSKLCNVLFGEKLATLWYKHGIAVFIVHPGNLIYTDISRYWWPYRLLFTLVRPFTKSLQQGAATSIYCATSLDLSLPVSGSYFNNCCRCPPSSAAQDEVLASVLWKMSEEMVQDVTKQWTEEMSSSEEVVF
uniref:WW domain-containing oxidoreductase n=1 Tax=Cacopsylla melanoneura TaxID=428564 RepID=A0A8D8ZKF4_9HEMI